MHPDKPTLMSPHPTHQTFVERFIRAVDAILREGFWLKPEADRARQSAEQSQIGW
jgi:hypothetical protein